MPNTAWMNASPREYGFYSNVNPNVNHPRWSQATERPINGDIFAPRIKTLMFNGYADEVAQLYSGMDLKKYFPMADHTFIGVVQMRGESGGAVEELGADAGGQVFQFNFDVLG